MFCGNASEVPVSRMVYMDVSKNRGKTPKMDGL